MEKEGNVVLKELAFVYNEHTIAISDTANEDQMEQMLGKPDNLKSHTYTADDGTNMDTLIGFTEKCTRILDWRLKQSVYRRKTRLHLSYRNH